MIDLEKKALGLLPKGSLASVKLELSILTVVFYATAEDMRWDHSAIKLALRDQGWEVVHSIQMRGPKSGWGPRARAISNALEFVNAWK